jgi:hypothetical protein
MPVIKLSLLSSPPPPQTQRFVKVNTCWELSGLFGSRVESHKYVVKAETGSSYLIETDEELKKKAGRFPPTVNKTII